MLVRRHWTLRGVVQGVGFRPHVARLAARHGLTGLVGNDEASVFIEAQGEPQRLKAFIAQVQSELPPLAYIGHIAETSSPVLPDEPGFRIVPSRHRPGARTLIPPDMAPCPDCLREMRDPADRRYRYPFITCTNCGPRLSIIRDLPYDRPATTMASFPMCQSCEAEYTDPANRRYHAQPISCFDCGPRLWLADASGKGIAGWEDGIDQARTILADGGTVAVKGIGGFTLFCDARQASAVERLRQRKRRPGKPFAVMAASANSAAQFADLSSAQRRELTSPRRPIVLAPMSADFDLAEAVAPGLGDIGVMLPSAPLHHLLVRGNEAYVATSGNLAGEPLRYRNDEAVADLGAVVDAFLTHNRPIEVPVEDSVLMASATDLTPIRRSRGYAPLPIHLGQADSAVLALGGELKNTFALTRDGMAFLSAHIGDMGSAAARQALTRSVEQMIAAHGRAVELVVADLHPDYATTAWAQRYSQVHGIPLIQVQHHAAHAFSLLAEHGIDPSVRAAIATFDGTGYGSDGTIWGGEILLVGGTDDPLAFERAWHLDEYWLPGGDSAQAAPWKCAVALLDQLGLDGTGLPPELAAPAAELQLLRQLPAASGALPGLTHRTTSAGRLFDAVASILGVRHRVSYEAQAAMELERLATTCAHTECAVADPARNSVRTLLAAVLTGLRAGTDRACLARRFHAGLAQLTASALVTVAARAGAEVLGLTGGVFQNRLFTADVLAALTPLVAGRWPVLAHRLVPANDGGLSLGQARAGYVLLTWRVSQGDVLGGSANGH